MEVYIKGVVVREDKGRKGKYILFEIRQHAKKEKFILFKVLAAS
jgi:hypothetical protein